MDDRRRNYGIAAALLVLLAIGAAALARFIDYVTSHEKVWVPKRIEIAEHWHKHHKPAW